MWDCVGDSQICLQLQRELWAEQTELVSSVCVLVIGVTLCQSHFSVADNRIYSN